MKKRIGEKSTNSIEQYFGGVSVSLFTDVAREIKQLNQTNKSMRIFGLLHGIFFILIGMVVLYRHAWNLRECIVAFGVLSGIGIASLIIALVAPLFLRPVHKMMFVIGIGINWFLIRLMLTCTFFLVLTPTGLLLRLFGKDTIGRKFKKDAPSYWIGRVPGEFDKNRCKHLF
jgi:hypothetical protein